MRRALYFPYMRVPETPWFTQVLLYWDVVGTIVPAQLEQSDLDLGRYVRDLGIAGLLEPVSPGSYTSLQELGRAFTAELTDNEEFVAAARKRFADPANRTRLHSGKAEYQLLKSLRRKRLAIPESSSDPGHCWWWVERTVADLYMASLAGTLSASAVDVDPVTDQLVGLSAGVQVPSQTDPNRDIQEAAIRTEIIDVVVPVPVHPVSVGQLVKFKERYGDSLPALRLRVEAEATRIATERDSEERQRMMRQLRRVLSEELTQAESRMRASQWRIDPLGASLAVAVPVTSAASAALAGTEWAACPAAALIPLTLWQVSRRIRQSDPRLPLMYAAYARHELGETCRRG